MAKSESRARRAIRLGVYLALAMGLVFAVRSLSWRAAIAAMAEARPLWLAIAVLINFTMLPLWVTQWRLLLPPAQRVGWRHMAEMVALTWAAQNTFTSLGGGASAIMLLVARGGLSRRTALSLYGLDQLLTGIAKLVIIALALALVPLPQALWHGAVSLSLLVGVAVLALTAMVWMGNTVGKLTPRRFSRGVERVEKFVRAEIVTLQPLLRQACGWPLMLALAKKLTEVGAVLAIQIACGIPFSVGAAFLITAAVSMATIIPSPPAFIGVFEATVLLVYKFLGVSAAAGLSAALLQHAAFLVPALGCGYFVLLLKPFRPDPTSSTARE